MFNVVFDFAATFFLFLSFLKSRNVNGMSLAEREEERRRDRELVVDV